MKISVISNLYPPYTAGGYEILCAQTIQTLAARGHDICVLTSGYGLDPDVEHPPEPGIRRVFELEQLPNATQPVDAKKRVETFKRNVEICRRELDAFRPNVAFVWNQRSITLGPALAAQQMRVPTVFYFCDDHLLDYKPRELKGGMGELVNALSDRLWRKEFTTEALNIGRSLCISRTLRDRLAHSGMPVSHAQVHYPGIILENYPLKAEAGRIHHPARLLYLGPLKPNKRIEIIIRALGILLEDSRNRITLTIAGNGDHDYAQSLERVAADLGVADDVLMMGRVDYEQICQMYRDHDIFVYASSWDEPFGLAHLEAMASGCPVLSTDCGGPTEYLVHEENSIIIEKDNPRKMAESIQWLLHNAVLRKRMVEQARKLVELKFNARMCFDQMETFLKKSARKIAAD